METPIFRTLAIAMAILPIATPAGAAQMAEAHLPCKEVTSIGVATMAADGTITLQILSLPPGPIAHSVLNYPPSHAEYQAILKHLGGLAPGQTRPVPPWC